MIWSSVEICVGIMVACLPHIRNLVRHARTQIRERKGSEKEPSNSGIFVNRSLAPITVNDQVSGAELHDEGGLLKESIATTTTTTTTSTTTTATTVRKAESRDTRSDSFASDADTQV